MRLIDADKVINILKDRATNEAVCGYMTAYDVTNSIIDEIDEQPVAYDVDKVVERLEKLRELDACDFDNCPIEDIHCCDCTQKRMAERAIEIVKGGGIDG